MRKEKLARSPRSSRRLFSHLINGLNAAFDCARTKIKKVAEPLALSISIAGR